MTDPTDPIPAPGPTVDPAAEDAAYLAAVRAELSDLEPDELEEVTDDLASHLHEVRSVGTGRPMAEILGPPQRYAAELRAAAGLGEPAAAASASVVGAAAPEPVLVGAAAGVGTGATGAGAPPPPPPPPPPAGPSWAPPPPPHAPPPPPPAGAAYRPGDALGRAVTDAADRVTGHRWWQGVTDFLPELVPAWWVVRAWLVVAVLGALTSGGDAFVGDGPILLPRLFGSFVVGLVALVAAIVWSVRWGRARRLQVPQAAGIAAGLVILAGVVVVLLGLSFVAARSSDSVTSFENAAGTAIPPLPPVGAQSSTETPLNVYAYRPDGTPVGPVLLYDESGRPLVLGGAVGDMSAPAAQVYSEALGVEAEVVPPRDVNGMPVPNLYPRQLFRLDYNQPDGSAQRQAVPPPSVQVPGAVTATATTATTAPTAPPTTSLSTTAVPATSGPATSGEAGAAPESTTAPASGGAADPSTTATTTP